MTEVVVIKLAKRKQTGKSKVREVRVRGADGRYATHRTLDIGSRSFGDDLVYVFGKNVAKARRENKRLTGATDVAIRKR